MLDIQNKKITILGAQRSALAAAKLITAKGGIVRVSDVNDKENCSREFCRWLEDQDIESEFNGHTKGFIQRCDLIVISPGVPIDAQPICWAKELAIPFLGEIEFAAQYSTKPIIAVTGSNGKTTVVNLIHQILTAGGRNSCLCGNIGFPFSQYILKDEKIDFYVLEVSSFQMESLFGTRQGCSTMGEFKLYPFKPHIAVLLNVSENHLDRHKDMDEYISSKLNVFVNQDKGGFAVINSKDHVCQTLENKLSAQIKYFNLEKCLTNPNYDAASLVAHIVEVSEKITKKVLADFKGIEHRMEMVCSIGGVQYINDSKSTTPKASQWALESLDGPVVWICGGRDKNLKFNIGHELVKDKVKCIIAVGEAQEKIVNTFKTSIPVYEAISFEESIQLAYKNASEGDSVLLSPMCASFDSFKNFEERGRVFKECVNQLQEVSADA